ncbi:uncharacterized protein K02A2.6-like [Teleopsis dalmanni]|uniref:uncharacterized protein K02A2.6-like n=1 Tax=Teleopsis dalmanni TaxID=139649 RepID=UPI0018CEF8BA|nr:uncharacterized protein K02A2.6-like [Teleopsis dalmanni]
MSAKSNINQIDQQETTNSEQNSISQINSILNMDSGATVSVLTQDTYEHLNKPQLYPCKKELFDYGKNKIKTLGEFCAVLKCGETKRTAALVVVCVRNGHNLFGTNLFELFGFEIRQIPVINNDSQLNEVLEKHRILFEPALGTIKQIKARLHLKQGALPKFCKSIWKPIKFSQWAPPIVLVTKPDGSLRSCGDFKTTVNKQIDVDQYPLAILESLLHMVRYGKFFSKIDLKDAYLQMELDDEAKNVLVVNTPLRLFQYQCLPFGIASAPALFQKYLEQLIHGTEGRGNYIDDIISAAETVDIHLKRLEEILSLLAENGIRCRRTKCEFLVEKLEYLGRTISASGILPDEKGVQAVKQLPRPKNVKEVEAFLGKVNYYHNFIPNFSQLAAPINHLRKEQLRHSRCQEVNSISINCNNTPENFNSEVKQLVETNIEAFANPNRALPFYIRVKATINTITNDPIYARSYPYPISAAEFINNEIKTLRLIISPCTS